MHGYLRAYLKNDQETLTQLRKDFDFRLQIARKDLNLVNRVNKISQKGIHKIGKIFSADLQEINQTIVPFLKVPPVLRLQLPRLATDILLDLPFLRPFRNEIEKIFNNSEFCNQGPWYRTILKDNCSVICGEDATSVVSLLGIAHELGHCLSENLAKHYSWEIRLLSEATAQILEEVAVASYLNQFRLPCYETQWRQYQRSIDSLNLYFYEYERTLLSDDFIDDEIFLPEVALLRESLFNDIGYQAVYANATLCRREFEKIDSNCFDFLMKKVREPSYGTCI